MPPSVEKRYKQLYFKFIKAENLPKMDMFGTIDAYIYLNHKDDNLRTKTVTMEETTVQWNQEMLIPLELPSSNDKLEFKVYDYNKATPDELVCSMNFSIKDILKTDSSKN